MCARKMKIRKLIIKEQSPGASGGGAGPRQCGSCKYWTGSTNCRAFPEGIPKAILTGKRDHTKPFPDDRGIRYEPST